MEQLEGRTLAEELRRRHRLPPERTLHILAQVGLALQQIHEAGIIHRDLKPENVFLLEEEGDEVRLMDTQVARLTVPDALVTAPGTVIGVPHYLSPEQCAGAPATPLSDIYACGVLAYEMLTGRPPFDEPDSVALMVKHVKSPPPPLEQGAGDLPAPLSALVLRALAKDPRERQQGGRELFEACEECIEAIAGPRPPRAPAPVLPSRFAVRVQHQDGEERLLSFSVAEVSIGRHPGSDVHLPRGMVSLRHARLVVKDDKFILVDLRSAGGTYLAGRRMRSPMVVRPGGEFGIGEYRLRIVDPAQVPAATRRTIISQAPPQLRVAPPPPGPPAAPTICAAPRPDAGAAVPPSPEAPARPVPTPPGVELRHSLSGRHGSLAFSPDGALLAVGSRERWVRLIDPASGQLDPRSGEQPAEVRALSWSPDGATLAIACRNQVHLWEPGAAAPRRTLEDTQVVLSLAFSRSGQLLATRGADHTIKLWDLGSGELRRTLAGPPPEESRGRAGRAILGRALSMAWSPDGRHLAAGAADHTIKLWDAEAGQVRATLGGHGGSVLSLCFSPDGRWLASGSRDTTIHIWEMAEGRLARVLEGHTETVNCVSFSGDGALLASQSRDDTVRLWRCDRWEQVLALGEPAGEFFDGVLAFHPGRPLLATLSERREVLRLWEIDPAVLLAAPPAPDAVRYVNAKVVLCGEMGVGKSALALVLRGERFEPTESTHGRKVWPLPPEEVTLPDGTRQVRELVLWDLAGQRGYRLVHQLHLGEAAVALVVFDPQDERDLFAGVPDWDRALRQAQRTQAGRPFPVRKLLVAARVDVGGVTVGPERIAALCQKLGFSGYFETSAKAGLQIAELGQALRGAIDWAALPQVSSTALFQRIRAFLLRQKEAGQLLTMEEDLYLAFLRSGEAPEDAADLRAEFAMCLGRVESLGLARRLRFGGLVLLQPELLDSYAAALIQAARKEPHGLGCIAEHVAHCGDFFLLAQERIPDRQQEELLIIAMIDDLLQHEIALRETAEDGAYLIFPSQMMREFPGEGPEGRTVIFEFDGVISSLYAALAVRLSHSVVFERQEMWRNAATFRARAGGACGIFLQEADEGHGRLDLFFDAAASEETRFQFEEYVHAHLRRRAVEGSIRRRRLFSCPQCGEPVIERHVEARRRKGERSLKCPVCETEISLLDQVERLPAARPPSVTMIDQAADWQRDRATAAAVIQGKLATSDYDLWLCHLRQDRQAVQDLGHRLREQGILPWTEMWQPLAMGAWQDELRTILPRLRAVAICIGVEEPWEDEEIAGLLEEAVLQRSRVGVVLLRGADGALRVPPFLRSFQVDWRTGDVAALARLAASLRQTSPGRAAPARPLPPSAASLRRLINAVLVGESDLEAFFQDHFPAIRQRFTANQDRVSRITLLLAHADRAEILRRLKEEQAEAVAVHQHLLQAE